MDQQGEEGGHQAPPQAPAPAQAPAAAQQQYLPLQVLIEHFTRLEAELRAAGAHSHIGTFSGEGDGSKFTQWTKDMERVRIALQANDERMRFISLQTLSGQAAEFAAGLIKADPNMTWDQLHSHLRSRYSDLADTMFARQKLKRTRQKNGESVQNFYQRIISLAEESYPGHNLTNNVLQEQLIEIFVDGLLDNSMAKRLLRARPGNMTAALHLATQEQQATRTYELRRGEQPMEVDVIHGRDQPDPQHIVSQVVGEFSSMMDHRLHMMERQLFKIGTKTFVHVVVRNLQQHILFDNFLSDKHALIYFHQRVMKIQSEEVKLSTRDQDGLGTTIFISSQSKK